MGLLLIALRTSASELTEILAEFVAATSEIKMGLMELQQGQDELRQGLDVSYLALIDSNKRLKDLESTSLAQKADLEQAQKDQDSLKGQVLFFQVTTVAGGLLAVGAIIIAIAK